MQIQETIKMLRWLTEHDARIQYTDAAVEVWTYALRNVEAAVAKQAVLEHYKANESIAASPGAISKRANNIKTSREAGDRAMALEPSKAPRHPLGWRARNPELWDQLFRLGQIEGNEDRRRASEARAGDVDTAEQSWMAA